MPWTTGTFGGSRASRSLVSGEARHFFRLCLHGEGRAGFLHPALPSVSCCWPFVGKNPDKWGFAVVALRLIVRSQKAETSALADPLKPPFCGPSTGSGANHTASVDGRFYLHQVPVWPPFFWAGWCFLVGLDLECWNVSPKKRGAKRVPSGGSLENGLERAGVRRPAGGCAALSDRWIVSRFRQNATALSTAIATLESRSVQQRACGKATSATCVAKEKIVQLMRQASLNR